MYFFSIFLLPFVYGKSNLKSKLKCLTIFLFKPSICKNIFFSSYSSKYSQLIRVQSVVTLERIGLPSPLLPWERVGLTSPLLLWKLIIKPIIAEIKYLWFYMVRHYNKSQILSRIPGEDLRFSHACSHVESTII